MQYFGFSVECGYIFITEEGTEHFSALFVFDELEHEFIEHFKVVEVPQRAIALNDTLKETLPEFLKELMVVLEVGRGEGGVQFN